MNSVAQVAIGILVLGTAFVFGSQMNNTQFKDSNQEDPSNISSEFVWQKPAFEPRPSASVAKPTINAAADSSQLIEMPVAKKRVPNVDPKSDIPAPTDVPSRTNFETFATKPIPTSTKQESATPLPIGDLNKVMRKEIVEPDFSELASNFHNDGLSSQTSSGIESLPRLQPKMQVSEVTRPEVSIVDDTVAPKEPTRFQPGRWAEREPAQPILTPLTTSDPVMRSVVDIPTRREPRVVQRIPITNFVKPSKQTEPAQGAIRPLTASNDRFQMTEIAKSKLVEVRSRNTSGLRLETNRFVRHKAQPGESLQAISKKYYGKPDFYLDVYLANQDVLNNPAHIPMGTTLRIPVYE